MKKVLLLSIVLVTFLAPLLAARARNPRRALQHAIVVVLIFNAMYLIIVPIVIRSPF